MLLGAATGHRLNPHHGSLFSHTGTTELADTVLLCEPDHDHELHEKGRRRTLKDGRILGPDGWNHDPAPRRPATGAAITAARTARLARLRADDRVADLASAVDAAVHVGDVVEADDLVEHDAQLTVADEPQQVRHVVGALP